MKLFRLTFFAIQFITCMNLQAASKQVLTGKILRVLDLASYETLSKIHLKLKPGVPVLEVLNLPLMNNEDDEYKALMKIHASLLENPFTGHLTAAVFTERDILRDGKPYKTMSLGGFLLNPAESRSERVFLRENRGLIIRDMDKFKLEEIEE